MFRLLQTAKFDHTWYGLLVYCLYRILLAIVLVSLYFIKNYYWHYSYVYPQLYLLVANLFLLLAVISLLMLLWGKISEQFQINANVITDFLVLIILLHASNDYSNDLSFLINVSIVAGSVLCRNNKVALIFASLASLALLAEHTFSHYSGVAQISGFIHVALLGMTFFASALISSLLAMRLQQSEALASARQDDILKLEKLNELIISRLNSGIIVINKDGYIQFANELAKQWLSIRADERSQLMQYAIYDIAPDLYRAWLVWQQDTLFEPEAIAINDQSPDLEIVFHAIDSSDDAAMTLVLMEDSSKALQQVQQIKLVSLGRLSASIAHEIRNPLASISHASQLLAESKNLNTQEQRFINIINDNSKRMDAIINNMLMFSKRQIAIPTELLLEPWLNDFIHKFVNGYKGSPQINITVEPKTLTITVDPTQLQQVLANLCENGLRYSFENTGCATLQINAGLTEVTKYPYIDVEDDGTGIADELASQLFEPFFTTERKGTGLGLYIAKELCAANRARLEWHRAGSGGALFRIIFVAG